MICLFFSFANIAVVFFFVLSGYLITYLLLKEKNAGKISVKQFYLRRVLRIWPVYYLVVILAFAFFNQSPFFAWHGVTDTINLSSYPALSIACLLFISPNFLLLATRSLGYANPTWSIGVEEQFYLIWPWIIKSKKSVLIMFCIILCLFLFSNGLILKCLELLHIPGDSKTYWFFSNASRFFTFEFSFKIDAMAIGALGAYIAFSKPAFLKTIFTKSFQYLLLSILGVLFVKPGIVAYQFYSIVFIVLILNLSINPNSIISLENRILNYGGKISYGIYMYHCFTIIPSIFIVTKYLSGTIDLKTEILICLVSLSMTILIASVSYFFYEIFFLQIKNRLRKKHKIEKTFSLQ